MAEPIRKSDNAFRTIGELASDLGVPQQFQDHASRNEVLASLGLTDQNIARQVTGWVAALGSSIGESEVSGRVD